MLALEAPDWVTAHTGRLSLSYNQDILVSRYVAGLMASANKTVSGISSMFVDQCARSMNRLLTEYQWDADTINAERLEYLQQHNETRMCAEGTLILDDTLIEKTGRHIPCAGTFYDHSKNRYVYGHCLVNMHYADSKTSYAIDYQLYVKHGMEGFKTKIELAQDLLRQYDHLPAMAVVWDAWYTCRQMVECVEGMGRYWIGACKSNLLVKHGRKYVSVQEWAASIPRSKFRKVEANGRKFRTYSKRIYIKSLGCVRRVIVSIEGKNVIFLLTNRQDRTRKILVQYMARWKIESFHKDAKQHLGLGKIQARNIIGIRRHWYLVFLAHSILRLGASESSFGRALIRTIGKRAKAAALQMLEEFMRWIVSKGDQEKLHEIVEALLYRQT